MKRTDNADRIGLSILFCPAVRLARREAAPSPKACSPTKSASLSTGSALASSPYHHITSSPDSSQLSEDMFRTRHLELTLLFYVDALHDAVVDDQGEALTAGAHSEAARVHL